MMCNYHDVYFSLHRFITPIPFSAGGGAIDWIFFDFHAEAVRGPWIFFVEAVRGPYNFFASAFAARRKFRPGGLALSRAFRGGRAFAAGARALPGRAHAAVRPPAARGERCPGLNLEASGRRGVAPSSRERRRRGRRPSRQGGGIEHRIALQTSLPE